jgi:hypothetical protein
MTARGRVYLWTPDPSRVIWGTVRAEVVPLPRLEGGATPGLSGRFVIVRNGGAVNQAEPGTGRVRAAVLGDAVADEHGAFLFEPGRGGGRLDKVELPDPDFLWRYVQAARFGEVNTYYHVDRIAAYVDDLLQELGAPTLPRVVAVVTAHPSTTERERDRVRDGVRMPDGRWVAFQGGHYRLPSRTCTVAEHHPLSPDGEIHLGPGRTLLEHGALVAAAGSRYRANASHNAGIIYHEYGHHIARHTADFTANVLRRPRRQRNAKPAIEEGTCDYWAATLLDVPHMWAWHHRHDNRFPHRRCLTSAKTMRDFDPSPQADPHANGTIWGAALWELRAHLSEAESGGSRAADLLVLQTLLLLGGLRPPAADPRRAGLTRLRSDFPSGLAALLHADERLHGGRNRTTILDRFAVRGIVPDTNLLRALRDSGDVRGSERGSERGSAAGAARRAESEAEAAGSEL